MLHPKLMGLSPSHSSNSRPISELILSTGNLAVCELDNDHVNSKLNETKKGPIET